MTLRKFDKRLQRGFKRGCAITPFLLGFFSIPA